MPRPKVHPSHAARQAAYRHRQEQVRARELAAKGLPSLPAIASMPGHARWNQALAHAQSLMGSVLAEMQSYFDERSEAWQEGERAQELQQRMDAVEESLQALENALT